MKNPQMSAISSLSPPLSVLDNALGELPKPLAQVSKNILTVSEVNARAKNLLESQLPLLAVIGEISNLKIISGHCYFCLKDKDAQLSGVLFKREAAQLRFNLKDGLEVIITGRLTIYPAYGRYQIVAEHIEPRGSGALILAFNELKQKLSAEGLFAPERKRPLPLLPARVAVITSREGAVIQDILNVSQRRYPKARILLLPTRVQGLEAVEQIKKALALVNELYQKLGIEVLILARGGGSLEDLYCFNDESVARAIFDCKVPVVSAIGHETDFTIADFVADKRAPTPSAAAEIVFPLESELYQKVARRLTQNLYLLKQFLDQKHARLQRIKLELMNTRKVLREPMQRLSFKENGLNQSMARFCKQKRAVLHQLEKRLECAHPKVCLKEWRNQVFTKYRETTWLLDNLLIQNRTQLNCLLGKLNALSPLSILSRGYSIVMLPSGKIIRKQAEVKTQELLHIRLEDGLLKARVE